jgi:hypothetical protein
MDENQEQGSDQEEIVQDEQSSQSHQTDDRFEALAQDLAFIKQQLGTKAKTEVQEIVEPELSAADLQRFQQDPTLLAAWMKKQTEKAKNEIKQESQKELYDRRAEEKFPLLKTDRDFQKKVATQINELISTGEYTRNNPMLVFRAAQLAAAEYQPKTVSNKDSRSFQTSAEGRSSVPRESGLGKTKITDDDPRYRFAKAAGLEGKQLERFKARLQELGPYQRTERKQARRLMK